MSKVEELLATADSQERVTLITGALDEALVAARQELAAVRQDLTAKLRASEHRQDVYAEASRDVIRVLVDAITSGRRY